MEHRAGSPDEPDDAFEAFFRREFASISRTAYLIVGDWEVAREISQDAFVQVLRHWEKVKDMESPGGWARRVAIRKAVRSRRRAMRGPSQPHASSNVGHAFGLVGCAPTRARRRGVRLSAALGVCLADQDLAPARVGVGGPGAYSSGVFGRTAVSLVALILVIACVLAGCSRSKAAAPPRSTRPTVTQPRETTVLPGKGFAVSPTNLTVNQHVTFFGSGCPVGDRVVASIGRSSVAHGTVIRVLPRPDGSWTTTVAVDDSTQVGNATPQPSASTARAAMQFSDTRPSTCRSRRTVTSMSRRTRRCKRARR